MVIPKLNGLQTKDNGITNSLVAGGSLKESEAETFTQGSITSDSLATQPSFDIPPTAPSTEASGELARFEAQSDQYTKSLEARAKESQGAEQSSFTNYMDEQLSSPTESQLQSGRYGAKGGVDDIQTELDSIDNELLSEQHALNRKLEEMDKNKTGLFGGALQDEKDRIERDSLRVQADMTIKRLGIQGRYDSAKAVADRAIDAEMDAEDKKIKLLKDVYDRNKSLFDKDEQRVFEDQQMIREAELAAKREEAKALSDAKIDAMKMASTNGAPMDIINAISGATTALGVYKAGGQYASVDMLDRQSKLAAIRASNLSSEKNQLEIDALKKPTSTSGASPETIAKITDLSDGKRTDLVNARKTQSQIDRMIELVNTAGDTTLLTRATKEGREFQQLADDVADKLARERTGAVVGKEEEKTFKRILGIGFLNTIASDDESVVQTLTSMRDIHNETVSLIDPTNEITQYLEAQDFKSDTPQDDAEVNIIWGAVPVANSTIDASKHYKN